MAKVTKRTRREQKIQFVDVPEIVIELSEDEAKKLTGAIGHHAGVGTGDVFAKLSSVVDYKEAYRQVEGTLRPASGPTFF